MGHDGRGKERKQNLVDLARRGDDSLDSPPGLPDFPRDVPDFDGSHSLSISE